MARRTSDPLEALIDKCDRLLQIARDVIKTRYEANGMQSAFLGPTDIWARRLRVQGLSWAAILTGYQHACNDEDMTKALTARLADVSAGR